MTNQMHAARQQPPWEAMPRPSTVEDVPIAVDPVATLSRHKRGERIRMRPAAGESSGRIIRGAARLCIAPSLGERRIIDFVLPGDFFELATYGQAFALEAACDDTVMAHYRSRSRERLAEADHRMAEEFRELSMATASRFRRQILILGRVGAIAKLGAFLLDMETRLAQHGADRVVLPMSRYDIADYLAMSVETVSRCITALRGRKMITLIGRREFRVVDRAALEAAVSCLN